MAKQKVLIVEDEPLHLTVMKAKLEFDGFAVVTAMDGEEGLNIIKSEKPDLVLLDIVLPKMDGFKVLEQLQREKIATPVIVVSNSGQPVEVDKAMKMGAKDYLVKAEFNPADVLEKVEKILGKPSSAKAANGNPVTLNNHEKRNAPSAAPAQSNEQKVLVVEDDRFLRSLITQKLQKEGFVTYEAVDGETGLKLAKEKLPDIVLLDLILPSLDGFEVLKILKNTPDTASIPVIVLSNLGQKEDMDKALSGGAEDFMVKAHFTPGEIIAKIKSVLKKKYF